MVALLAWKTKLVSTAARHVVAAVAAFDQPFALGAGLQIQGSYQLQPRIFVRMIRHRVRC